jgi:putative tryptophan/tyrosine transport system substrate-binding protein
MVQMQSKLGKPKSKTSGLAIALFLTLLPWPHLADAQQPAKIPRIGYVSGAGDPSNPGPAVEAFRQGLRDRGYMEGKNIVVEYRYAEGRQDRVPSLVSELVQLKVDVLVLVTLPSVRAAKEATKTIPIVMVLAVDPVATGIVNSLARPGGNITGLATLQRELSGKRLELLKEVIPAMSRVGVLWDADAPGSAIGFQEYEEAARTLKVRLQSLEVRGPEPELEGHSKLRPRVEPKRLSRSGIPCFVVIQSASQSLRSRIDCLRYTTEVSL